MAKFIVVDSVKGGCGKTIESLSAAIRAYKAPANEQRAIAGIEKRSVCIVDMDLLGSSIERTIAGLPFVGLSGNERLPVGINSAAEVYLNSLVINDANFHRRYVSTFEMNLKTDTGDRKVNIGIVIASPRGKDRSYFHMSSSTNFTLQITPTQFQGTLRKLVKELALRYDTVIFDMPPNEDPYTDAVFDVLLDIRRHDKSVVESVILELMSTYDIAHLHANISWLNDFIGGRDQHWKDFDNIFFILNDVTGMDISDEERDYYYDDINDELSASGIRKYDIRFKVHNDMLARHFMVSVDDDAEKRLTIETKREWWDLHRQGEELDD